MPHANDDAMLEELRTSVAELARRGGLTPERAFAAWYASNLLDLDEDDALEAAALDGGEDQGIDLICTDATNERVIVLQAHYPSRTDKATPKAKWDALVAGLPYLENPEHFRKSGRSELAAAVEEAIERIEDYEVVIALVSFAQHSDQIERALATTTDSELYKRYNLVYHSKNEIITRYRAALSRKQCGAPYMQSWNSNLG